MVKILQDAVTGETWNVESEWNVTGKCPRCLQMARMLAQQTKHPININQFAFGKVIRETTVLPRQQDARSSQSHQRRNRNRLRNIRASQIRWSLSRTRTLLQSYIQPLHTASSHMMNLRRERALSNAFASNLSFKSPTLLSTSFDTNKTMKASEMMNQMMNQKRN